MGVYFHLEPLYAFAVDDPRDRMLLGTFLLEGILLSTFSSGVALPAPIALGAELGRYVAAGLAVFVATLLKLPVYSTVHDDTQFMLFYAAVLFSAWNGGLGPGLFATTLAALVADYLFISPRSLRVVDRSDLLRLGLFSAEGAIVTLFGSSIHVARWGAAQSARMVEKTQERVRAPGRRGA